MSDSMNRGKSELSTIFEVPGKVPVCGPGPPLFGDGPWLLFDPSASSESRHGSISISRVVHQAISIWIA
jgi:hypothetical protein